MNIIEPGHIYQLDTYDLIPGEEWLLNNRVTFMERIGTNYPGNTNSHPGTNLQETLRMDLDRLRYLDAQKHSEYNLRVQQCLRYAIYWLELRAANQNPARNIYHNRIPVQAQNIDLIPTCRICGHITCPDTHCLSEYEEKK